MDSRYKVFSTCGMLASGTMTDTAKTDLEDYRVLQLCILRIESRMTGDWTMWDFMCQDSTLCCRGCGRSLKVHLAVGKRRWKVVVCGCGLTWHCLSLFRGSAMPCLSR